MHLADLSAQILSGRRVLGPSDRLAGHTHAEARAGRDRRWMFLRWGGKALILLRVTRIFWGTDLLTVLSPDRRKDCQWTSQTTRSSLWTAIRKQSETATTVTVGLRLAVQELPKY